LDDALETKQDTLTAGENITIDENNVISAVGGGSTYTAGNGIDITDNTISIDTDVIATQNDLSGKQDILTAGSNITISNNVISATDTTYTAGEGIDITNDTISVNTDIVATQSDLDDKQDTLTAGNHIEIINNVIDTKGLVDMQEFDDALLGKQDTLTAGTNITIDENNVISASGSSYTAGNGIDITNNTISLEHNIVPLTQSQYNALERSQQLDATAIYFIKPEAAAINIESATDASTGSDIDMWVSEQMTIDGVTRTVWHQAAINTYGYGSNYYINDQKCYIKFRNLKSLTIKARLTPLSDAGLCSYNYPYYSQVDKNVDTSHENYGDNTNNKWCGRDYSSNDWYTITYNDLEIDDQWHTIEVDHKIGLNGNPDYYSYTNDQFFIYDDTLYNYYPSSYDLTEYDWMHLVGVSTQYAQDGSPLGPSFELGSYSIFSPIKSTVKWTNDSLTQVHGGNLLGSRRHQMDTLSIFQYANGVYCDYGPYETSLGNGYRVILNDNITNYEDIYTYQMWINSVDHTGHLMNYDTGVQVNGSACDYTTPMTVYAYPQCENSTIYNIQIMAIDNSRIVANWVPCKNSNDVPCWFDTKTGTIANMTVQDAGLTITLGND